MKILKSIFIYFVIANMFFTAPLRFLFSFVLHAEILNYLMNIIFVLLIISFKKNYIIGLIRDYFWYFTYFLILILYSMLFESFLMIGFYVYILISLVFFGLFKDEVINVITNRRRLFTWVFAISALGLVYDYYADFPWKSLQYTVAGKDIDLSRDWTFDAVERVSGFYRNSYEAALGIIFLGIVLLYKSKNILLNHLIFLIIFICTYITTTKTCLISIILIYIVYIANTFGFSFKKRLLFWIAAVITFFMISLPLGLITDLQIPLFNNVSFSQRILDTWPYVIKLFNEVIQYILGVGFGSLGTAQQVYGNSSGNSGDNLFIYLYGNIGVMTFVVIALIFARLKRINNEIFVFSTIFLLSYGITANMVESPLCQLIIMISLFAQFNTEEELPESSDYQTQSMQLGELKSQA